MRTDLAKPSILIVDDDRGLRLLMRERLEDSGYHVNDLASADDAVSWLEKHTADLMLLDWKLREGSADGMLRRLSSGGRHVPFIMITGQGDERVAVAMMKEGALDYVMKDRSLLDVLPRVVKQALDGLAHSRKLFEVQTALSESQAQLLEVSEKERRRMGHDLHDGLGQHLTAAEFLCHALLEDVSKPEWKERQRHLISQTEELGRRLREATATTRSLARGLAPVKLDEEGLMSALSDLAARTSAIGVMHCAFRCSKLVLVKESLVATHLFRIAQEAVTNALKHSHARRIMLTLTQTRQLLSLEVKDDGRGFPRSQKPASSMGLEVMQHRAKVIHATLQVSSHPGSGVTISCQLPLLAYASSTQSSD